MKNFRRSSSSSESDDPPPVKRACKIKPELRRTGGAHDGGQQFEIKVAAAFSLRGLYSGDSFKISTNVANAGNFDDLVYTNKDRYFFQLKHTENVDSNKMIYSDLKSLLLNCFLSYCEITEGVSFKDVPLQNSHFMIYTNKLLGRDLLKHNKRSVVIDSIFRTNDQGEIFSFLEDKNTKIDVYKAVKQELRKSKEFKQYDAQEQKYKLEKVDRFLERLVVVTGQKGQNELDNIIMEDMKKHDTIKMDNKTYDSVFHHLKLHLDTWWRNRTEEINPNKLNTWLQEAKTATYSQLVESLYKTYRKNLHKIDIKFDDNLTVQLKIKLVKNRAVHLRTDSCTLGSVLIVDCVPLSECIFVTGETFECYSHELLYAWQGGVWDWLIIDCVEGMSNHLIKNISINIVQSIQYFPQNKHVVILTHLSVPLLKDFIPWDNEFEFYQLEKDSQELVLKKNIYFQGIKVSIGNLLQRHGNVHNIINSNILAKLLIDEKLIEIGDKMTGNMDYYAPRVIDRNIYLNIKVLSCKSSYPDLFAVSEINHLAKFVPPDEIVGTYTWRKNYGSNKWEGTYDGFNNSRFIEMNSSEIETCFLKLCEKFSDRTIHWLEFQDGRLLWKESRGKTDNLWDHIDGYECHKDKQYLVDYMERHRNCGVKIESAWDIDEKILLVVAEPGMGKSTSMTHLALTTKLADSTSWVVRVNWNEHSKILSELSNQSWTLERVIDLLSSSVVAESNYYLCETKFLLKQALETSGNIVIIMDGYDEISPTYASKAATILNVLQKTSAGRIWLTSRPVVKDKLEKELSIFSYNMRPLSRASQTQMLFHLWESKAIGKENNLRTVKTFIKLLLKQTNESLMDKNFTGFPLYISMIAIAFEESLESMLISGEIVIPEIMNLYELYEKFIDRKLDIYQREKKREDVTNASIQDDQELLKELFIQNHEKAALLSILPQSMLKSLHDKRIEAETQTYIKRVQEGKDKTGIVIKVVEGRPYFVHRTFAEYFVALWFSKHFEYNKHILEDIFFHPTFHVVKNIFDRIMSTGRELHLAILNWDPNRVELGLRKGLDVNSVDNGGRTPLHLIAAQGQVYRIEQITDILLSYKTCISKADFLLHWTPLRYAERAGSWFVVERLLENGADPNDIVLIRKRFQDSDYIGPILYEAAGEDYLSLMKCLSAIGVDVNQKVTDLQVMPLHVATASCRSRMIRWLIEQGADCNGRDNNGWTPLFHAVNWGLLGMARLMVEKGGADVNTYDIVGKTPLDWALNNQAGGSDSRSFKIWSEENVGSESTDVVNYLQSLGASKSNVITDGVVIAHRTI